MFNLPGGQDLLKTIKPANFLPVSFSAGAGLGDILRQADQYVGLDLFLRDGLLVLIDPCENPDGRTRYRCKTWEAAKAEPDGWLVENIEGPEDSQAGSFLLVAHNSDVTIGDVRVTPLDRPGAAQQAVMSSRT